MRLETKIKLEDINGYYGTPFRYWITKFIPTLIINNCPITKAKILDIGCGQGQYSDLIINLNIQGKYLGIDLNSREYWNILISSDKLEINFKGLRY